MNGTPARGWFHVGAWLGLGATVYTNYRSAPVHDLQVAYLVVPVLAGCYSEGLMWCWRRLPVALRTVLATILALLLATSYEHLRSLTIAANGTWFAANVGSGVIDLAIFGCVLATCSLSSSGIPVSGSGSGSGSGMQPAIPEPEFWFPEFPETGPVPVPVSGLDSGMPATKPETGIAVPEFAEPPATYPPFVPEHREPSEPIEPISAAPTSGARAAKRAADLERLTALFGQEPASSTDIARALDCGGSRATRLATVWAEHLELNGFER
jgi:hypothetical protein